MGDLPREAPAVEWMRQHLATVTYDEDHCLEWDGSIDKEGYGRIWIGGRGGRDYPAHRLAMCVKEDYDYGEIEGWLVRHQCNNRRCFNPHHLLLGDDRQNVLDRVFAGRSRGARGEHNARSTLSDAQVEEIRVLADRGWKYAAIAREFGVSAVHVGRIVNYQQRG